MPSWTTCCESMMENDDEKRNDGILDKIRLDRMSMRTMYPEAFPKLDDLCGCCRHLFSEHDDEKALCRGRPLDLSLSDGDGCPCNGFEKRGFPS